MQPVLVVGAGPTGLTAACVLRSAGVPVRVVDAAPGPAVTSRALGLQPRGVEVLDRIGALGDLPQRSLPVNEVIVSVSGRELTRLQVGRRTRLGGHPGLLVSQAEIESALRRRLAELGGAVEWGRSVTGVDQDAAGVTVRLAGGPDVRAGWLIGCDGAHSTVRKASGIGFPGVPLGERFLIADVRADLDRPRQAAVWLRGDDMLAAFPLPGDDLWRLMTPTPADGRGDPDPVAVLARMRERVAEETGRSVRSAEWTSSFRIHRRLVETYRRGRVLLAGDAAHIHSPLGGQGMNTGFGDAENLAWKLALVVTGRAGPALLDTYEAERRPVAAEVLNATSGATNLLYGDGAAVRFVRDHFVVPLMNRPSIQRMIAERSSQLLISYRGGPLATRGRYGARPRPGDRIRDLPGHRPDGTATRLHAELCGRWAVLALAGSSHARVARAWLGTAAVAVVVPDPARRDVLLVRPDAHLAWRGGDPAGMAAWLADALGDRAPAEAGVLAG